MDERDALPSVRGRDCPERAESRLGLCYDGRMETVAALPGVPETQDISAWHDHVVLCGLGRIGEGVAEALLRADARLVVIDSGPATPFKDLLARHGVPVLDGDSTRYDLLQAAGVRHARVVIVTISHDMSSLKTALAARELNLSGRVVMRLFNQRMADHLRALPVGIEALSLSAMVAPVFALAAQNRWLRGAFALAGTTWAIGSVGVPPHDAPPLLLESWRRLGMAVLACTTPEKTVWFPSMDQAPPPGARLLVATNPARLKALGGHPEWIQAASQAPNPEQWLETQIALGLSRRPQRSQTTVRRVLRLWRHTNIFLRLAVSIMVLLFCCSVSLFYLYYPLSLDNAFYFTAALITTVGLGDINLLHASVPLKLYGVFVMLTGAVLMAVIYALIAEAVVSERIAALLGAPQDDEHDHFVVAGVGTVGFRIIRLLRQAGERVVAIEESEQARFVSQVRAMGVPVVVGDTLFEDTLHRAQITRARAFICVTSNDLANIEAALNARALNPDIHVVVRVFDHELAVQARRNLDIPAAFSTAAIGAPLFASAAIGHEAPRIFGVPADHPGMDSLSMLYLQIDAELAGQTVGQVARARGGAALLHEAAGAEAASGFAPAPDSVLGQDDLLVLAVAGEVPLFETED
jgi:voltage-gated potassium channel Kch